ncbi:MAG: class I SAM-dependent rRNA methyltransferase [Bacteroidales bacterium]|jgi:23S rRNA (cytosine1962-C5)-methyltransferase
MKDLVRIVLRSGKDKSLKRYHPWVFSGAIKKIFGEPSEGDVVKVYSNQDEFLGTGHYQEGSISIRILSFMDEEIGEDFYITRIKDALAARAKLGLPDDKKTNVCRLVNAEGDGLPGFIIDYYNGTAVMQFHSIGMHMHRDLLVKGLQEILGDRLRAVYDKSATTLPSRYATGYKNEYLSGSPSQTIVKEHGNQFSIDWEKGQKTGFFIDQRENRKLLGEYSDGRNVLNLFGYTGGFSVYARQCGAELVHTVDSSAHAIDMANKNMELNFGEQHRHQGITADVLKFLVKPASSYDLMILDPPAFAKHHNVLNNALQGYKRLNARAIEKIKPGGIIFTFSCSQAVSKENFRKSVFAASANTGRRVRILHQLTQPADHPVSIYHLEGEYLKGLVLLVD